MVTRHLELAHAWTHQAQAVSSSASRYFVSNNETPRATMQRAPEIRLAQSLSDFLLMWQESISTATPESGGTQSLPSRSPLRVLKSEIVAHPQLAGCYWQRKAWGRRILVAIPIIQRLAAE